jgi:hypothetical protein
MDARVFPFRPEKYRFLSFNVRRGTGPNSKLTHEARCTAVVELLHCVDDGDAFQRFLQSIHEQRRYPQPEHADRPRTPFQYVSDHSG